jgi:hypothetical protein
VVWPVLLVVAAVVGFYAGRFLGWWALLLIPPVAAVIWTQVELEGGIPMVLASFFSMVLAAAIVVARGVERIRTR